MSRGLDNGNPLPTALEPGSPRSSLCLGADPPLPGLSREYVWTDRPLPRATGPASSGPTPMDSLDLSYLLKAPPPKCGLGGVNVQHGSGGEPHSSVQGTAVTPPPPARGTSHPRGCPHQLRVSHPLAATGPALPAPGDCQEPWLWSGNQLELLGPFYKGGRGAGRDGSFRA